MSLSSLFATSKPMPLKAKPLAIGAPIPSASAYPEFSEEDRAAQRLEKKRKLEQRLSSVVGVRSDKYAEAVVVVFDEGYAHDNQFDGEMLTLCRTIAGRYWKIGINEGSPIFRQD